MEGKNGIGDWNFFAETNLKIAKRKMGKFHVSFRMELFQRLTDIFETAYHSLLGLSFLNSSYEKTSEMLKRAALFDQYCTLILVHVDCVFYGLSRVLDWDHQPLSKEHRAHWFNWFNSVISYLLWTRRRAKTLGVECWLDWVIAFTSWVNQDNPKSNRLAITEKSLVSFFSQAYSGHFIC